VCFLGFETDPASLSVVDALPTAAPPQPSGLATTRRRPGRERFARSTTGRSFMRLIKTLVILSVGTVATAQYACATTSAITAGTGGSSGTVNTRGVGGASGSTSSGGNGDGAGSSSGAESGSNGSGGAGEDAASDDGSDPAAVDGNCPDSCPGAGENCCLVSMAATVWGICATQSACLARGGGFLACGSPGDCGGADSATPACCLMGAGAIPSTVCTTSCPAGSSPACNVDETTCPNGGAGFQCTPVSPSIPVDALGTCTPSVPGAGGDSGSTE
jgi:hypothetical protein